MLRLSFAGGLTGQYVDLSPARNAAPGMLAGWLGMQGHG
jgi:hypothetical protein